jgi:hypothetical protein
VTSDESLFDLCTDHELIWLQPGEEVPNHEWKAASWTCFSFESMFHIIHPGSESDSMSGTIAIDTNFERNYEVRLPIP